LVKRYHLTFLASLAAVLSTQGVQAQEASLDDMEIIPEDEGMPPPINMNIPTGGEKPYSQLTEEEKAERKQQRLREREEKEAIKYKLSACLTLVRSYYSHNEVGYSILKIPTSTIIKFLTFTCLVDYQRFHPGGAPHQSKRHASQQDPRAGDEQVPWLDL
jgi:hypothetical protein